MSARRAGFLGDSRALSVTALLLAVVVSAALFVVSYQGLAYAGEAIGLAQHRWIVPVALDGGILVAGLLAAVRRGQKRGARLEVAILWLATIASSAANVAAHAVRSDGWLAIGVASIAPWFFLALTESIIRTVVQDSAPERKSRRTPKLTSTDAPVAAAAPPLASSSKTSTARKPRAVVTLPTVSGDAEALLARAIKLAPDPRSRERTSPEAVEFRATVAALVNDHAWSPTRLSEHLGEPDRHRVDRAARAQRKAMEEAA